MFTTNLNGNKIEAESVDKFHEKMVEIMAEQGIQVTKEELKKAAERLTAYLTCPSNKGNPVQPIACQFCPCGHMTECHFPFHCNECDCSHN